MFTPRPYQLKAHEQLIEAFKLNKKTLLVMMAGAGKSKTVGSFIAKYHKHFNFVLIVRKRDLVEQLSRDALHDFGLDYSVYMAGDKRHDPTKKIQVCSKDTLQSRDDLPFLGVPNTIVIIDEADEFPDFQKEIIEKYSKYDRFFYCGMTATPFNDLSFYDTYIEPIKPKELLAAGVLVPFKYFIPKILDLSDVKIQDGAYNKKDLSNKLDHPNAIKDSFEAWQELGDNRLTLVFCINKQHGKNVRDYINLYYNKDVAAYCDADTPKAERERIKKEFKNGKYLFLINVKLFTRGTNIVEIGTILDLASTLSVNNHIQKIGRGSRKNDFYSDCILIDCANNLINNGGFYSDREIDLTSNYKKTKADLDVQKIRRCEKCFRAADPVDFGAKNICPYCGHSNRPVKVKKLSDYAKNKLFMETASEEAIEQRRMIKEYKKLLWKKKNLGKRYPYDIAKKYSHIDLLNKYGYDAVAKIKKSIGLTQESIDAWKYQRYEGLKI